MTSVGILDEIKIGDEINFKFSILLSSYRRPIICDCKRSRIKVVFFLEKSEKTIYFKKLNGNKIISEGTFSQSEMIEKLKNISDIN